MTWLARLLVELSVGIVLIWEYLHLTLEMYVNPLALKSTTVVALRNAENMYSCQPVSCNIMGRPFKFHFPAENTGHFVQVPEGKGYCFVNSKIK
jgi:hypothetical protein